MTRRTVLARVALMAAAVVVAGVLFPARAAEVAWLRVGSGVTSSWSYSCMVAISEAVRTVDPDIEMVLQATPGSTTHYSMFAEGEIDIATGTSNTDYWAGRGDPPLFDRAYEGTFYHISSCTFAKTNVIVRQDSGINSMSDLNGKKIFVGDPGGASTLMSVAILKMLGIKATEIQTDRLEGVEMMKEGRVDAVIFNVGTPYSVVLELNTAVPVKLVPFTQEEIAQCEKEGPFCFGSVIQPTDGYEFVKEPLPTLAVLQSINASAKLDDEVVYRLTKAIVETWPDVVKTVPAAGVIDPARDVLKSVAKIHPGAVKYYEEIGVKIPDRLKP